MVPVCANIASQQFWFAYDRLKGACILYTLTFFPNFEHLKQLKEASGVDKLGTELEIAQNWKPLSLSFPKEDIFVYTKSAVTDVSSRACKLILYMKSSETKRRRTQNSKAAYLERNHLWGRR